MQIRPDDGMRFFRRPGDVADGLRGADGHRQKRKRGRRIVAPLNLQARPIDGSSIKPGRGSGLQPAHRKAEPIQRVRQTNGRRLHPVARELGAPGEGASRRDLTLAAMDQALQKRPGGQNHGGGMQRLTVRGHHCGHSSVPKDQIFGGTLTDFQIASCFKSGLHLATVKSPVRLRPRPTHRRPFAPVEHAELDSGSVRHPAHQPVGRIDLPNEVTLADPTDSGIAGHFAQRRALVGEQQRARSGARRCRCRLAAGMASANDNDVVSAHAPFHRRGRQTRQASRPRFT